MTSMRLFPFRRAGLLLAAIAAATLLWPAVAGAQTPGKRGLLKPSGTPPGQVAPAKRKQWAPVCANKRRRPMVLVLAFDKFREYRPAQTGEAARLNQLLDVVCPGDVVAAFEIDKEFEPLGNRMVVKDLADLDDLALRVEERREPREFRRINQQVIQAATAEWGRPEHAEVENLLRVLIYFTRDLESRAPRSAYVEDFNWAKPPYWLAGHALVALFKPITSDDAVVAWETFIVATPGKIAPDEMDQGIKVNLQTWLDPVRIEPEPPKPKPVPKTPPREIAVNKTTKLVIPEGTLPDPKALWRTSDEDALLWNPTWTPWILSGVLGLLLLLTLGWSLLRRGAARGGGGAGQRVPQLTLIVRDRIHDSVASQERVRLDGPLRVGASMTSDVVVPGPYALEILPGAAGGSPRVRSTNSLGLEVQRVGSSRTLRATESVPVQLRSGDRINLGGGHLLEIRIA